jgi:hypothetical protein
MLLYQAIVTLFHGNSRNSMLSQYTKTAPMTETDCLGTYTLHQVEAQHIFGAT